MKPRAIKNLAQLADSDLFDAVSEGLVLLHDNMSRLNRAAEEIRSDLPDFEFGNIFAPVTDDETAARLQGGRILASHAEEEAAKYLILLDAIRCPKQPPELLPRHLLKFYNHLARGIYAKVCAWHPADFAEVEAGVRREREAFYLDGPMDVDFIYRNQILADREDMIYVDYVVVEGESRWLAPPVGRANYIGAAASSSLPMVGALHSTGIAKPKSLAITADVWRSGSINSDMHWQELKDKNLETLRALEAAELLHNCAQETYRKVIFEWPFPMHGLDLQKDDTRIPDLEQIRRDYTGYR